MKQIAILTGAGASFPFGYPTTYHFFKNQEFLDSNNLQIINSLKSHLKVNGDIDLETVLRTLEPVSKFLENEPGNFIKNRLNNGWGNQFPKLIELLNRRCFNYYGKDPDRELVKEKYIELFDTFELKFGESNLYEFFTTNYDPIQDILIEIMEESEIKVEDGFNNRGKWDNRFLTNSPGFNFYRLHGSLSWIEKNGSVINTRDYSARDVGFNVKNILIYPGYKGNPSENKESKIYKSLHDRFKKVLDKAEILVVIGFSFRDPYLTSIIKDVKNKTLKMIYINPKEPIGPEVTLNEIKSVLGKNYYHIDGKFATQEVLSELQDLKL